MRRLILPALLALVVAAPPRAHAQDADRALCFSINSDDYKEKDKYQAAEDACTRMVSSGHYGGKIIAAIHRARGSWRRKRGNLDGALADYALSIKMEPKNAESFDYRADVYRQKGDLDRALADYDRASKVDPYYAPAHYSRGVIFEKKNDLARARAEYKATLDLPARDRIAQWAQDKARARLAALDDEAKEDKKEEKK